MKHTTSLVNGFYYSKHHNEYKVVVDKYSGNNYRVVAVYEDYMTHLIGKTLTNGHGFRRALKSEQDQFKLFTADTNGNQIDEADDLTDAVRMIQGYEEEDRKDGTFTEGFYEIEDEDHCKVWTERII